MNQKSSAPVGHLCALFVVLCWGTSFIVSKSLLDYMTPIRLIWLRFLFAYLALWILHPKWHFSLREEVWFFLLSIFSNTLYFLAENTALGLTQSSNVSILTSTIPLMTAFLLFIVKGKKMEARQITGSVLAFFGVVLVILNGVFILKISGLGDVLALCAALCWSIYSLLISDKAGEYNGFLISRKLMFYGFLTVTPIMLAEGAPFTLHDALGGGRIFALLYLALICSALCYVLWNKAIFSLGMTSTNTYLYAMPLFTLVGGVSFLHERITLMGGIGILIVIVGMLITNGKKDPGQANATSE